MPRCGWRARWVIAFVILFEFIPASRVIKGARVSAEPASISVDGASITSIRGIFTAKPTITATAPDTTSDASAEATTTGAAFNATELVAIGPGFLSLGPDTFNIAEKFRKFLCSVANIDALVLAVLVVELELAQHFEKRKMASSIVDDSFRTILDQEFEQL